MDSDEEFEAELMAQELAQQRKREAAKKRAREEARSDAKLAKLPAEYKRFKSLFVEGAADPADTFELRELLGEGTFGAVYRARRRDNAAEVAVKIMLARTNIRTVQQEVQALEQCACAFVVGYQSCYLSKRGRDLDVWVVMECCAGGSLVDLMSFLGRTLNESEIRGVLGCCVLGLSHLHGQSVPWVHQDIKGANILVSRDGVAKLADLGTATKSFAGPAGGGAKPFSTLGTPYYFSPEALEAPPTPASDVWALGITVVEMAEGQPPHIERHPQDAIEFIQSSPSPTLNLDNDALLGGNGATPSADLVEFLAGALAKAVAERTATTALAEHVLLSEEVASLRADGHVPVLRALMTDRADEVREFRVERFRERLDDDQTMFNLDATPRISAGGFFFNVGNDPSDKDGDGAGGGGGERRGEGEGKVIFEQNRNVSTAASKGSRASGLASGLSALLSGGGGDDEGGGEGEGDGQSSERHSDAPREPPRTIGVISGSFHDSFRTLHVPVLGEQGQPGLHTEPKGRDLRALSSLSRESVSERDYGSLRLTIPSGVMDVSSPSPSPLNSPSVTSSPGMPGGRKRRVSLTEDRLSVEVFDEMSPLNDSGAGKAGGAAEGAAESKAGAEADVEADVEAEEEEAEAEAGAEAEVEAEAETETETEAEAPSNVTASQQMEEMDLALPAGVAVELRGPVLQMRKMGGPVNPLRKKVWKTVWLSLNAHALVLRKGELEVSKVHLIVHLVDLEKLEVLEGQRTAHGFRLTARTPRQRHYDEPPTVTEVGAETDSEMRVWLAAIRHNAHVANSSYATDTTTSQAV